MTTFKHFAYLNIRWNWTAAVSNLPDEYKDFPRKVTRVFANKEIVLRDFYLFFVKNWCLHSRGQLKFWDMLTKFLLSFSIVWGKSFSFTQRFIQNNSILGFDKKCEKYRATLFFKILLWITYCQVCDVFGKNKMITKSMYNKKL